MNSFPKTSNTTVFWRQPVSSVLLYCLLLGLAACGGSGSSAPPVTVPPPPVSLPGSYADSAVYSSSANAQLASGVEGAATTQQSITLNGKSISYTAKAGHLTARTLVGAQDEASFFYVAYTTNNQPVTTRPITFFYNGGPGSASVWLHLGSFGPKRLVTGVPATSTVRPFALVDNAESLLDVSDLVFVNAIGTGFSQAIAPYTNRSFWGVDTDAAVFRDFVQRYLAVNGRQASPKYLYGESYGGPRSGVLASLLESAGIALEGVVLQSPAMNYNSNCGVTAQPSISCDGYLPSYAAIGSYYQLVTPAPASLSTYMTEMRSFAAERYAPAVASVSLGASVPADLPPLLNHYTGLALNLWQTKFNLQPGIFQTQLLPNALIGRYDGRMSAPNGSALASEGDPSSTFISASFASAITSYLRDTLLYSNNSTYVLLSNAIESWDFSHAGKSLLDSIPDLGAALALNPKLRVLAVNGYHDLATPFYQTEQDLIRLNLPARIQVRNYPGGHMTYLDDGSRVLSKAALSAFYQGTPLPAQAAALTSNVRTLATKAPRESAAQQDPVSPFVPTATIQTPSRDPWVPVAQRPVGAPTPPSQGSALQAEIESRLRSHFEAAAGGANNLTRVQAEQAGLSAVASQFEQIDARKSGKISFEDWRNYLRRRGAAF